MDCSPVQAELILAPLTPNPISRQLADQAPAHNPTMTASDDRWQTAKIACQLFRDAVKAAACETLPLIPPAAFDELLGTLLVERIAAGFARVLKRLDDALAVRFQEHRIVDNECYVLIVTDILTGEREEFTWTYGGGKAAQHWKVARLLALAGKGVTTV